MKTESFFVALGLLILLYASAKETYKLNYEILIVNKFFKRYYLFSFTMDIDNHYEIKRLVSSKSLLEVYRLRNKILAKEVANAV